MWQSNRSGELMRILNCGESALLVEFDSLPEVAAFIVAAEAARAATDSPAVPDSHAAGITDLVPGARTVLVCFEGPASSAAAPTAAAAKAIAWIRSIESSPGAARPGREVEIPVHYDGPDLAAVAEIAGLTIAQVISAHTESEWTCAFGGFAPGFAYLAGGDPRLHMPRKATPRIQVPAGSVGLAGEFSGVYPRESPGGWQLLGRTAVALWDLGRNPPALIRPGDTVRFRAQ